MLIATLILIPVPRAALAVSLATDLGLDSFCVGRMIIKLIVCMVCLYAAFRLIKMRDSTTIKWATVAVWLNWAGLAVANDIWFFYEAGEIPPKFPITLAWHFLISGACAAYLKFSKRVRNTYLLT